MTIPSVSGTLPPSDRAQLPAAGAPSRGTARDAAPAASPDVVSAAERALEPPPEHIQDALREVRKAIAPVAQNLLFMVDEDTGRTVIKVVDSSTDEVIRQIPSEEILAIAKALDKLQGVLIQQKA